jgi:hypothetical protein
MEMREINLYEGSPTVLSLDNPALLKVKEVEELQKKNNNLIKVAAILAGIVVLTVVIYELDKARQRTEE